MDGLIDIYSEREREGERERERERENMYLLVLIRALLHVCSFAYLFICICTDGTFKTTCNILASLHLNIPQNPRNPHPAL